MELIASLCFGPWRYHCKPKAPDEILSAHWMNVTWGSRGLHELTHAHWKHFKSWSSIMLHRIYWQPLASDSLNFLLTTRFWQTKWKLPRISHFRTKGNKIERRFRWLYTKIKLHNRIDYKRGKWRKNAKKIRIPKNSLIELYDKTTKIIVGTGLIKHALDSSLRTDDLNYETSVCTRVQ